MTGTLNSSLRPALFCDRDGVLIEEVGYIRDPALVRLIPGVAETVRRFNQAGIPVISVSNQSGVARGLLTCADVEAVQSRMIELLAAAGANLTAMYFAPHHPEGTVVEFTADHEDRKPRPGMLLKAAAAHRLDLRRSWMVGDRITDLEAGWNAGVAGTALVQTGYGAQALQEAPTGGSLPWTVTGASLAAVAEELFRRMRGG